MSHATLLGTPDPDRPAMLPSPAQCSCILTANTSGPFGMNMSIDGVVDPQCARHRPKSLPTPRRNPLTLLADVFAPTARHKYA